MTQIPVEFDWRQLSDDQRLRVIALSLTSDGADARQSAEAAYEFIRGDKSDSKDAPPG